MLLDPETLDLVAGDRGRARGRAPPSTPNRSSRSSSSRCSRSRPRPAPTSPTPTEQLAGLRRLVGSIAERNGMLLGAAGTHPFARCDDQRIVDRDRYRELVEDLGFIAERELIFGTHVHVGIDSADKAIYVADGIRRHLPLLLALSSNSPFWEGRNTGLMSARTPGLPGLSPPGRPAPLRQLGDLRPPGRADDELGGDRGLHLPVVGRSPASAPGHGRDADLRPGDPARGHRRVRGDDAVPGPSLLRALRRGRAAGRGTVRADRRQQGPSRRPRDGGGARRFLGSATRSPPPRWPRALVAQVEPSAAELGCTDELGRVGEIIAGGTGARRQLSFVDSHGDDLRELVEATVALTAR